MQSLAPTIPVALRQHRRGSWTLGTSSLPWEPRRRVRLQQVPDYRAKFRPERSRPASALLTLPTDLSGLCLDTAVTAHQDAPRIASASREIGAIPARIFELIADPTQQPRWDGNDNLTEAADGQRIRKLGDVFSMTTTRGNVRENHVVEFEEGRRIAWKPAEPGQEPPGHLWRWELEPIAPSRTRVTHTYDWTQLTDEKRFERARATTADRLQASLDRLATLVEGK